jgi:hypothetical protein
MSATLHHDRPPLRCRSVARGPGTVRRTETSGVSAPLAGRDRTRIPRRAALFSHDIFPRPRAPVTWTGTGIECVGAAHGWTTERMLT